MAVLDINKDNFDECIKNGRVLVDCYANWCGPCKMLSPIIDEVSEEVTDCIFYKLNVDEEEEIAAKYGIMSIPTLLYFENGKLLSTNVGLTDKKGVLKIIEKQ